jgi:glutathione synthase/RimK-type ligase-like ATP-grasp enzyme
VTAVLIATCQALPDGDEDQERLNAALRAKGIDAVCVPWDSSDQVWDDDTVVIIRATWDYTDRLEEFLAWADAVTRLSNPVSVLRWNTDKRYLDFLANAGIPTIPTTYASRGQDLIPPPGERFVVKPTVGAGSRGAQLFEARDVVSARRHVDELARLGKRSMVQPYLFEVEEKGETAVVVIDGVPSHAIEKAAMLVGGEEDPSGLFVAERIRPRTPSDAEVEIAQAAIAAAESMLELNAPLLYARVDLLPSDDGPRVIELELTEPSLFLWAHDEGARRLAEAISNRL